MNVPSIEPSCALYSSVKSRPAIGTFTSSRIAGHTNLLTTRFMSANQ